jgi:protein-L-isoaspartate(D-aspartate) O-methyltransferase
MKHLRQEDGHEPLLMAEKIRLIMKLRGSGITDTRVLAAIEQVPREMFVPRTFLTHAYEDKALPIAQEQTISQPYIVALMTQALQVEPKHVVLEIGTGSGYQAAILSVLARRVHTIERHKPLYDEAAGRFETLKLRNITAHLGDGAKGWPHAAPYDRIMVTAAAEDIPPLLLEQLAPGGIMVIPLGDTVADQQLYRVAKTTGGVDAQPIADVRFVPLVSE